MVGQSKKSVLCLGVFKKGMPYVTVSLYFVVSSDVVCFGGDQNQTRP